MYLPRRHYRRLLLPPGWVALGLLLLLGCQALLTHERQLRLPNVMQLTMPPLQSDEANRWRAPVYGSVAELNNFRPWRDTELTGTSITDFINAASIEVAIKAINANTSQAGGVRVRFGQQATYGNLVRILDMMNRLNQKKYWLDSHHKPATFYAITDKSPPTDSVRLQEFFCGTNYQSIPTPTEEFSFKQALEELWQSDWRFTTLLFAAITVLSVYRLAHLHRLVR